MDSGRLFLLLLLFFTGHCFLCFYCARLWLYAHHIAGRARKKRGLIGCGIIEFRRRSSCIWSYLLVFFPFFSFVWPPEGPSRPAIEDHWKGKENCGSIFLYDYVQKPLWNSLITNKESLFYFHCDFIWNRITSPNQSKRPKGIDGIHLHRVLLFREKVFFFLFVIGLLVSAWKWIQTVRFPTPDIPRWID